MTVYQKNSSSNDIAENMERSLIESAAKEQSEEALQIEMFKSLDAIAALAEKYEEVGMVKEATVLIQLLEAYAEGDAEAIQKNLAETQTFGTAEASDELEIDSEGAEQVQGMLTFDDEV